MTGIRVSSGALLALLLVGLAVYIQVEERCVVSVPTVDKIGLGISAKEVEALLPPPYERSSELDPAVSLWTWGASDDSLGPSSIEFVNGKVSRIVGYSFALGSIDLNDSVTSAQLASAFPSVQLSPAGGYDVRREGWKLYVFIADEPSYRSTFYLTSVELQKQKFDLIQGDLDEGPG